MILPRLFQLDAFGQGLKCNFPRRSNAFGKPLFCPAALAAARFPPKPPSVRFPDHSRSKTAGEADKNFRGHWIEGGQSSGPQPPWIPGCSSMTLEGQPVLCHEPHAFDRCDVIAGIARCGGDAGVEPRITAGRSGPAGAARSCPLNPANMVWTQHSEAQPRAPVARRL